MSALRKRLSIIYDIFSAEACSARNIIWRCNAHSPSRNAACTDALKPALSCASHSFNMALAPHDVPPPDALPATSAAALPPAAPPVAPIPSPGAHHVRSDQAFSACALCSPCPDLSLHVVCSLWPRLTKAEIKIKKRRFCLCGKQLSGYASRIEGIEVCARCYLRHSRGEPQLYKDEARAAAAARSAAAAAAARPPEPPPAVVLQPPAGSAYPTRHALASAASSHTEGLENISCCCCCCCCRFYYG